MNTANAGEVVAAEEPEANLETESSSDISESAPDSQEANEEGVGEELDVIEVSEDAGTVEGEANTAPEEN